MSAKKNGAANTRTVIIYPSRRKIEVAPGIKVAAVPKEDLPEIGLVHLQAMADGTLRPVLRIYDPEVRASVAARILKINYRMLMRLIRAGFVSAVQPAPRNYLVNVFSYFEHIEKMRQDPDFWMNEKNRRRYRDAL